MEQVKNNLNKLEKLKDDITKMAEDLSNFAQMNETEKQNFIDSFLHRKPLTEPESFFQSYVVVIICTCLILILFGKV